LATTPGVVADPISGDNIRKLREDAHLSQAVEVGARRKAADRPRTAA
jgi:hypothetical protein